MVINIHERDITSAVCQLCGECCRIRLTLQGTEPRYRKFLRQVGMQISPPPAKGRDDCCDGKHDVIVDLGYCIHLRTENTKGDQRFTCGIYGTREFPDLCAQYNCVSWAKARNGYNEHNAVLRSAQRALELSRGQVSALSQLADIADESGEVGLCSPPLGAEGAGHETTS